MTLGPGDHACCIYESGAQLVETVAGFVADGLRRGERCWYVAAGGEEQAVLAALVARGIDVAAAARRGALSVIPASEAYPLQDSFAPERSMQVFSDAIEQALSDGFSGFRAAADMSWALTPGGPSESLIVYEALLKALFSSSRVAGLCLYPRRMTPLKVLNGVLATHPLAATRGSIAVNPFYDAQARALVPADGALVAARLKQLDSRALKG